MIIVSKENYDKLKQNDRIEYLLLEKKLLDNAPKFPTVSYISQTLIAIIVLPLLLMAALGKGALQLPIMITLATALGFALKLVIILFILECIVYIFEIIKFKKEKKELVNKFFEIKTKR